MTLYLLKWCDYSVCDSFDDLLGVFSSKELGQKAIEDYKKSTNQWGNPCFVESDDGLTNRFFSLEEVAMDEKLFTEQMLKHQGNHETTRT